MGRVQVLEARVQQRVLVSRTLFPSHDQPSQQKLITLWAGSPQLRENSQGFKIGKVHG